MTEAVASLRLLVRTAFTLSPRHSAASFLEVCGVVLQRLSPIWVALVVAGATTGNRADVTLGVVGLAASLGLGSFFVVWGVNSRLRMLDLVGHHFDHRLAAAVGSTPTLEPLHSAALRETLQIIKERLGALGGSFNSLVGALNGAVPPIASLVVAIAIDWRLGLLALATLPSFLHTRLSLRWEAQAENTGAEAGLISGEWNDTLAGDTHDELRSYSALSWASDRALAETRAWRRPMARAEARAAWVGVACDLLYAATAMGVVLWIMAEPPGGVPLAAVLVAAILVATDLREGFEGFRDSIEMLGVALRTLSRYRAVTAELGEPTTVSTTGVVAPSGDIRLRGVSFRYPDAERCALRAVDADLPRGSVVAVVGENGSGKSTLVKLLLGLYTPDTGQVTIGGSPLTPAVADPWRRQCSGVFQDPVRFQLSVAESVGVGDLKKDEAAEWLPETGERVSEALTTGGFDDVMKTFPQGVDTQLGSDVGRRELSGGQWQRLATARGMLRESPSLLVLDEPTSALDPHAESTLLRRLMTQARMITRGHGVSLIVTHRLSTTRHADLVLVMHKGQLIESGTHRELIASGGHYADLYELHAGDYRDA